MTPCLEENFALQIEYIMLVVDKTVKALPSSSNVFIKDTALWLSAASVLPWDDCSGQYGKMDTDSQDSKHSPTFHKKRVMRVNRFEGLK